MLERVKIVQISGVFLFVLGVFALYRQGFFGGVIVLDDNHLFERLGKAEGPLSVSGFFEYLSLQGGLIIRPISFLTFYLQKDAMHLEGLQPFKVVNVFLHIVNMLLVFVFSRMILLAHSNKLTAKKVFIGALLSSVLWGIATINVSAVLYVTQRMVLLSTFFSLIGLIFFLKLRLGSIEWRQFWLLLLVVSPLWLLGTLSKSNGVLVLFSVLVIEWCFFSGSERSKLYRAWLWLAVLIPIAMLFAYFVYQGQVYFVNNYAIRNYGVFERLVVQPEILVLYLTKFLVPFATEFNLLGGPQSVRIDSLTYLAVVVVILLVLVALKWRRANPVFSFAVLFFLTGHLLESTVLPLELYFDHRNYFPLVAVAIGCSYFFITRKFSGWNAVVWSGALFVYLIFIGSKTYSEVLYWSNPLGQAIHWYEQSPASTRAHSHLGRTLEMAGLDQQSYLFYEKTVHDFASDPSKYLLWVEAGCRYQSGSKKHLSDNDVYRQGFSNKETIVVLNSIVSKIESQSCPYVEPDWIFGVLNTLEDNQNFKRYADSLILLKARILQVKDDYAGVIALYEPMISEAWRADVAMSLAEKYYMVGDFDRFKEMLSEIKARCDDSVAQCGRLAEELDALRGLELRLESSR